MSGLKRKNNLPLIDFTKKELANLRIEIIVDKPGLAYQTNKASFYFEDMLVYAIEDDNFNELVIKSQKTLNNLMNNKVLDRVAGIIGKHVYHNGHECIITFWSPDLGILYLVPTKFYGEDNQEENTYAIDFLDESINWETP